ncbi:MAG: nucleotidyltransferase family protein [Defluviitaleaceae bacterium]|nr:nucleotidyltransferase family protein [Defluviitaleaceae bacterium]
MKAAGVIVEFNPLHNGHIEHLQETKRLTGQNHIIGVMSGNFVQRGEPALCDKWRRTKMALQAGVDIVIELPVPYVVSGADYFARGSIGLLAATGVVDSLCFGSESGEANLLKEAGRILAHEPDGYKSVLKQGLNRGLSFAAARGAALESALGTAPEGFLTKPNNCLGMEYCKAIYLLGTSMGIFTSNRLGGGPSATAIRKEILTLKNLSAQMPKYVQEILQDAINKNEITKLDDYSEIFRFLLYTKEINMGEGLENRFRHYAREHPSLSSLMDAVKTKRYTYTRLQRAVISTVLRIEPNIKSPGYIRILGFKKSAAPLLGEMTRKATLPVITTGQGMDNLQGSAAKMLATEFIAGDIYQMTMGKTCGYRHERGIPMVIL